MRRRRPSAKPNRVAANAFAQQLLPPTYERLIAQLRREYPEYSQAEIEAAVADVAGRYGK